MKGETKMNKLDYMKVPKLLFNTDDFDILPARDLPNIIITYIHICMCESLYDFTSNISIGDILLHYGNIPLKNKPKSYYGILESLKFLTVNGYIKVIGQTSLNEDPPYKNIIRMELNSKFFHPDKYFFNIYIDEINALNEICLESNLKKDLVFTLYFYIRSTINSSSRNMFFCNTETILENIGFTKIQIESAMKLFIKETNGYTPLLIKVNNKNSYGYKCNESFMRKDGHNIPIERKF